MCARETRHGESSGSALPICISIETKIVSAGKLLPKKLAESNLRGFWKEVKSINGSHSPLPTSIDEVSGEQAIAELWKDHFKNLFNCLGNEADQCPGGDMEYTDNIRFSPNEVKDAISNLKLNKACGEDGIYTEHLKHASPRLYNLPVSLCMQSFLIP